MEMIELMALINSKGSLNHKMSLSDQSGTERVWVQIYSHVSRVFL